MVFPSTERKKVLEVKWDCCLFLVKSHMGFVICLSWLAQENCVWRRVRELERISWKVLDCSVASLFVTYLPPWALDRCFKYWCTVCGDTEVDCRWGVTWWNMRQHNNNAFKQWVSYYYFPCLLSLRAWGIYSGRF